MDKVHVHCYGCPAVVSVDSRSPENGLRSAGWSLVHGETYCPECARARGVLTSQEAKAAVIGDPVLPPTSMGSEAPSRELAMLRKIEERAKRYIGIGVIACFAGALLFAGLSSSPVGVLLGAFAVVGGPFLLLWDERMGRTGKQAIGIYLALAAFWFVAFPLVHGWGVDRVGQMLRWIAVLLGPAFIWTGIKTSRMLSVARNSLSGPVFDGRLEIKVLRSGFLSTMALLWRFDSDTPPPLAWFGWHLSEPQLQSVDKVSAKIYGAPTKSAVVVVSCPEAVLVGRVKRSHFGELSPPSKSASVLAAWLWKPRSLRLP